MGRRDGRGAGGRDGEMERAGDGWKEGYKEGWVNGWLERGMEGGREGWRDVGREGRRGGRVAGGVVEGRRNAEGWKEGGREEYKAGGRRVQWGAGSAGQGLRRAAVVSAGAGSCCPGTGGSRSWGAALNLHPPPPHALWCQPCWGGRERREREQVRIAGGAASRGVYVFARVQRTLL